MASLADLFNPTFLMFLGILVLVVAMVVVYFESKMREQNHKINSMLSLVSTLAEDICLLKMGFHQIATNVTTSQYGGEPVYETKRPNYLEEKRDTKLIEVSDDESESDDESDNDSVNINANNIEDNNESVNSINDDFDEDDLSMDDLSDDTNEEKNLEQIKVFKINVDVENVEDVDDDVENVEDVEDIENVGDLSDLEDLEEKPVEQQVISASELKTININLEEPVEKIDYKKLQLPKLKSVVVEKGLATSTEASKLKKGELLKLLGIE